MNDDAAMLRATADAVDGNGKSPIWWLAQAIELRALAERLDQRETCAHGVAIGFVCNECSVAAGRTVGLCNDPNHSEPFACYRQAEGGFVCESTHRLETLLTAVQQLEHLVEVAGMSSAVDRLHPALVTLLNAANEARG